MRPYITVGLLPLLAVVACGSHEINVGDLGGPDASTPFDVSSDVALDRGEGAGGGAGSTGGAAGSGGGSAGVGGKAGAGGATSGGNGGSGAAGSSGGIGGNGGFAGKGGAGAGGAGASGAGAGGAGAGGTGANGGTSGTGATGGASGSGGTGATGGASGSGGTGATGGVGGTGGTFDAGGSGGGGTGPALCGGVKCAATEECCLETNKCFDKSSPLSCQKPGNDGGTIGCASNLDCNADEFCQQNEPLRCDGIGTCMSRSNCGNTSTEVCGCDGVTYANRAAACWAGVRMSPGLKGCGVVGGGDPAIYCGLDSQCPSGSLCCALTGRCYEQSKPGLCEFTPTGTSLPCYDNSDCAYFGGYCYAYSGCTGPAGCKHPATNTCVGPLEPICGCDNKNYLNASCADASQMRIRHYGYCTDAEP